LKFNIQESATEQTCPPLALLSAPTGITNSFLRAMKNPSDVASSLLRRHAADALRRARRLPVGHARNDLRQLAMGLLWLEKKGLTSSAQDDLAVTLAINGSSKESRS
jgi:hypothetical protein